LTDTPTNIIADPFNTVYDVTPQTNFEDLTPEYYQAINQQQKTREEELKAIETGLIGLSKNPDIEELLLKQVHRTVSKHDDHVIKAVFHVALSAYIKPLNLGAKAESGAGKTYSTIQTIKFLPDEDVQPIGSQSPKVISHETGVRKTLDGEIINEDDYPTKPTRNDYPDPVAYNVAKRRYDTEKKLFEEKLKNSVYEVDLRKKILLFLESMNLETFKMFKTTMSHDHEYIDHKYVDDKGKVHVTRLVGAPAIIFNSVDNSYVEEFATRTLSVTPKTTPEKIEAAMQISNKKSCYPWTYDKEPFNQRLIKEYIRKIKHYINKGKIRVAIPFDGLTKAFSKEVTRDMRDFNKFLELIPSYALFKLFQRPIITIKGTRYLIPTVQDALDAKAAFDDILETTTTSTDNRILEFYHKTVKKYEKGAEAAILTDEYNKDRNKPYSVGRIREWLRRLEEIGYIDIRESSSKTDEGYVDRRFNIYIPLKHNGALEQLDTKIDGFTEKNTSNTTKSKIDVKLIPILKKSFKTWLENTSVEIDSQIIILNIDGTAQIITLEELKQKILNSTSNFTDAFSKAESNSKQENKAKNTTIPEIVVKDVFSRTLEYEVIDRSPGVYCSSPGDGYGCTFEAEYNINGNLYCPTHFKEQVKFLQDNGTGLKLKETSEVDY